MPRTPDRLSALDAAFLDLETPRAPMHVGWTMRFAGAAPTLPALRLHLDGRLDALPRFRRRVVRPPFGLGDPHWADDAGFDVARHVHAMRLAPPAGADALRDLAGVLLSAPLDPARPLWRIQLITGLAPDGFAIVGQAHHALVDGLAAIEIATLLFDALGPDTRASGWAPEAAPSARRVLRTAASARLDGGARSTLALARSRPGSLRDAAGVVGALTAPTPATGLDRSVTRRRRVAFAATPLADLRATAERRGTTINDVLLAGATIAVARALDRRGERHDQVRALVPASTRTPAEHASEHGNRISFLAVELPVGEPDPARVLQVVHARTRARKLAGDAGAGDALLRAADLLPAPGRRAIARAAGGAARFTVIVSNVPGPAVRLGLLGRPLTAVWPAVPLIDGHGLSIGAISYDGVLHAGVYADAEVVPDAAQVAEDLGVALADLCALPARGVTPWRARARARRAADGLVPAQPVAASR